MNREEALKAFGLNAYEARVYIALLGARLEAKRVAEESGVPQSRVYDVLRSLGHKGFVLESGGAYSAVRPSNALAGRLRSAEAEFRREQAARGESLREVVADLEPLFSEAANPEPTVLKGIGSIGSAFAEVLSRGGDVYLLVRRGLEAKAPFLRFLSETARPGGTVRVLVPRGARLSRADLRLVEKAGVAVRSCDGAMLDVMVGGETDVIVGVPARGVDEPFGAVAIWVRDGSFASSMRNTAEGIWRTASPLG